MACNPGMRAYADSELQNAIFFFGLRRARRYHRPMEQAFQTCRRAAFVKAGFRARTQKNAASPLEGNRLQLLPRDV